MMARENPRLTFADNFHFVAAARSAMDEIAISELTAGLETVCPNTVSIKPRRFGMSETMLAPCCICFSANHR